MFLAIQGLKSLLVGIRFDPRIMNLVVSFVGTVFRDNYLGLPSGNSHIHFHLYHLPA